jgi:type IV fimbrial biogenesis protein FimT
MQGTVMRQSTHPQRGFTLTELLLALVIAGILTTIGAPAMGNLLSRTRDASAEAMLAGSLHQARTVAVTRNTRVLLCPSRDGAHCRTGDNWQHGWIIASDADADGQPDAGAAIIAAQAALPPGTRVISSRGRGQIIFHPNGNAAGSNARFTICGLRTRTAQAVIVANSGRVRLDDALPDQLQACLAGAQ